MEVTVERDPAAASLIGSSRAAASRLLNAASSAFTSASSLAELPVQTSRELLEDGVRLVGRLVVAALHDALQRRELVVQPNRKFSGSWLLRFRY